MSFKPGTGYVGVNTTDPSTTLEVNGDLKVNGAIIGDNGPSNGSPFPRPSYDSDWFYVDPGNLHTLTHNLGGDPNNYFVYMTFYEDDGADIHQRGYGTFYNYNNDLDGARWFGLTNTEIKVQRGSADTTAELIRIRIWLIE